MKTTSSYHSWNTTSLNFHARTVIIACLVAALSYLVSQLGGALIVHPQMLSPLWPGCVLLVSVLLLVPKRMWPALIAAAIATFILYDLQHGVPVRSIGWLISADVLEILIAAFCLGYAFNGVPRLNSVNA